ncbi:GNAT family N-acetyltransferase [Actinoplanes sp. NPDC048796]|uniref:GNAT family N-acetyltransferase n=1 Tax=Actinoplanes sp. NPDC048796 TaxID=3155640 RepID=UPI0033C9B647
MDPEVRGAEESMFVAASDGGFVAKATCFTEPPSGSAQVVGFYVTPRFRGSGVAGDLMAVVKRWAREEAGADRLRLFVVRGNERATAFYRRAGFTATGVTRDDEDEMAHDLR